MCMQWTVKKDYFKQSVLCNEQETKEIQWITQWKESVLILYLIHYSDAYLFLFLIINGPLSFMLHALAAGVIEAISNLIPNRFQTEIQLSVLSK